MSYTKLGTHLVAGLLVLAWVTSEAQPDVLHPQWLKQCFAQAKTNLERSECVWAREAMRPRAGGR